MLGYCAGYAESREECLNSKDIVLSRRAGEEGEKSVKHRQGERREVKGKLWRGKLVAC
jgi:hypothetical protein